MSKPLIGVMPLWDEGKKSIWMLPGYLEGIREAGGTPVIFPLTEDREELEGKDWRRGHGGHHRRPFLGTESGGGPG